VCNGIRNVDVFRFNIRVLCHDLITENKRTFKMSGFVSSLSGEFCNGFLPYMKIRKKAQGMAPAIVVMLKCEALTCM
jgi:hypothetical protein